MNTLISKQLGQILLLSAIAILVLGACRPVETLSDTKHEFGKTSVPVAGLYDCKRRPEIAENIGRTHLPKTQKYLEGIGRYIMERNPQTFKGTYAFEKFCFILESGSDFNATAVPTSGLITFSTGLIAGASSDAAVAAVMGHELAHVTMQHGAVLTQADLRKLRDKKVASKNAEIARLDREELSPLIEKYIVATKRHDEVLFDLSVSSPEGERAVMKIAAVAENIEKADRLREISPTQWKTLSGKLAAAYDELHDLFDAENAVAAQALKRDIIEIEKELEHIGETMNRLGREVKKSAAGKLSAEQIANGTEREADEVGLEFHLRAGLDPKPLYDNHGIMGALGGETTLSNRWALLECVTQMILAQRTQIQRGAGTHPSSCWRIFNLAVTENNAHKTEYDRLRATAKTLTFMRSPSLSEVKDEIQNSLMFGSTARDLSKDDDLGDVDELGDEEQDESAHEAENRYQTVRKETCIDMGGEWDEQYRTCTIKAAISKAQGERYCREKHPNTFYHGPVCLCVPKAWKGKDLNPLSCEPRSEVEIDDFDLDSQDSDEHSVEDDEDDDGFNGTGESLDGGDDGWFF